MSDIEKENNKFSKIAKDPLPLIGKNLNISFKYPYLESN
jgi:hypothetical protein